MFTPNQGYSIFQVLLSTKQLERSSEESQLAVYSDHIDNVSQSVLMNGDVKQVIKMFNTT